MPTAPNQVEANAVLTLTAGEALPRDDLESLTAHVEEVLRVHAEDIAPGASASANFATNSIEIDLVLEGETPADVHRRLAEVIGRLQQHGGLSIRSDHHTTALYLTSTASQVAAPPVLMPA